MINYKETDLSKRKHADFKLKAAEIVISLAFAGLFGTSAKTWIAGDISSNLWFPAWLFLLGVAGGLGVFLMHSALKLYAAQEQVNSPDSSIAITVSGDQNPTERLDAEKPISIVIERASTKISIRVE